MKNENLINELTALEGQVSQIINKLKEGGEPVAGWYKCNSSSEGLWLCFFDGESYRYGFDSWGKWVTFGGKQCVTISEHVALADPKEVEARLIKEAEKRGYENGRWENEINYNCLGGGGGQGTLEIVYHKFFLLDGELCHGELDDVNVVFSNGKWATIIEPKLTFGCYDAILTGSYVRFNGWYIKIKDIRAICALEHLSYVEFKDIKCRFKVSELKELLTKIDKS